MKLVELLAREMNKWPEDCTCGYCMQANESTQVFFGGPARSVFLSELADNRETARVTAAQWQAERDRQKGGEWKRHRGGKQPVENRVRVECKLRCGDIQQGASDDFIWPHADCDVAANIMKFRVISQPQAEEVEVIEPISTYKEFEVTGQWHQIDGPLAWRDRIIHCQAIIEDCEREIERNVQLLDAEGLMMQVDSKKAMQAYDVPAVDMGDWRNWDAGDEIECVFSACVNIYTVGNVYTVQRIESDFAVVTDDTCYGGGTCHISDADTDAVRFIRRP